MPRVIRIRNVPDDLHRRLEALAAMAGMSVSDYVLGEIRRFAERPTRDEVRARLVRLPRVEVDESPADAVRAERGPLP